MRLVCPYVKGQLNPDTQVALWQTWTEPEFVELDQADEAGYGRLVRNLWVAGEPFVICEQDVIPTRYQLGAILTCDHQWCSYNYEPKLYPPGPMFGLVRFGRQVLDNHPLAATVATIVGKRRDTEAEWWRIDSLIARDLQIRGVAWHEHTPAVRHAHVGAPSGPL